MRALTVMVAMLCLGAADNRYHVSAQGMALAPNAGGQKAYAVKVATNRWEAGVFRNEYITAGDYPLMGGTLERRFPVCDDSCFWQFFVQAGGGASSGGPLAHVTWGMKIPLLPLWLPTRAPPYVPALRVDLTTQIIFIQWRGIAWSYPLWAGITVPF